MRKNIFAKTISLLMISSCVLFAGCEKSSDERVDLYKYIGFMDYQDENDKTGTKPDKDQIAVIFEDGISEYRAILIDGGVYLDIEAVQDRIDSRFYYDKNEGYFIFTDGNGTISSIAGEADLYENGQKTDETRFITKVENNRCYVLMDYVAEKSEIKYKKYDATGDEPARLVIHDKEGTYSIGAASDDTKMRDGADLMNAIVTDIYEGEEVTILEDTGDWYKATSEDGYTGYVQKKYFESTVNRTVQFTEPVEYERLAMPEKVKLVWHQVTNMDANSMLLDNIANMHGANVISPTWLELSDNEGGIKDISSSAYVSQAKNEGLQVWPLVNDFMTDDDGVRYVENVLSYTTKRRKLEDNIIAAVNECGADGVNIDFEYISYANAQNYLQFLREMHLKCHENGLMLSVDNYVPSEWSSYYNLKEQGRLADYVVIMSYDEHTSSSDTAGPVASLPFVKKAMEDTLTMVDANRVIMGVPFYTRVWKETPEEFADEDAKIIEDSANGNYALSSEAVGMDTATDAYKNAGADAAWNEESGCNYVYYEKDNARYMIWLEDTKSIQAKLDAANEYEVAGIGCWKLGLESADVWDLIDKY